MRQRVPGSAAGAEIEKNDGAGAGAPGVVLLAPGFSKSKPMRRALPPTPNCSKRAASAVASAEGGAGGDAGGSA